jgi:hypothetical protein
LRDLEMAFLGKITASMTHEISNTLAIIQESAGLLSDLINLSKEGSFPHKEKFQRVLGNINDQVRRGGWTAWWATAPGQHLFLDNLPGLCEILDKTDAQRETDGIVRS